MMKKILSLGLILFVFGSLAVFSRNPPSDGDTAAASDSSSVSSSVSADDESQEPDASQSSADLSDAIDDAIDFEEPEPLPDAPYKGMPESQISSTQLGSYTTREKCTNFYDLPPRRRSVEYRWYTSGIQDAEHLRCVAQVSYWDYRKKQRVDGYVLSVTVYD